MKIIKLGKSFLNSIRKKLVIVFLVTTLLTSMVSVLILSSSIKFISQIESMFNENVSLGYFIQALEEVDSNVSLYLTNDDSDALMAFYISKDYLELMTDDMAAEKTQLFFEEDLLFKDIITLEDAYLVKAQEAVEAKQNRDAEIYISKYEQANEVILYIKNYINKLNLKRFDNNTGQYLIISGNINNLITANIILIIAIVFLNVFVVFFITYSMTNPIIKLAHSAEEISKGNFSAEDVVVTSNDDELKVMADAFNAMKHSIKEYIEELYDKAETESKLMDEQMRNLKMQSLLNNAELKSLQSQINPHFLFNTLNAGVQLAIMEGADRTSEFMEDVAMIFRYNVQSLDRVVTLREEIEVLKSYSNLFKVRYGDRMSFEFDIADDCLELKMPPLVIQPLVENAAIHGIDQKESGGTIKVKVEKIDNIIYLSVEDDGIGMDSEVIKGILNEDLINEKTEKKSGHTTGIGTHNVIHRLRLFYQNEDVMRIESIKGKMTRFTIVIPVNEDILGGKDV
ncbi:MAG: histidine kinase [Clostridia bacterium]|nr:histidine kinase [Clostridia bacterium]